MAVMKAPMKAPTKRAGVAALAKNPKLAVYTHNYIAFGSDEHKAMLGLLGEQMRDPSAVNAAEAALNTMPQTMVEVAEAMHLQPPRKKPITPKTYTPDDHIIDGFYRVGR